MTELLLAEFAEALNWALPQASAPARFARMLAELVPSWRVEPPDKDAADVHFAAMAPGASGCSVTVTADWPSADGYRDIDEWTVTAYGGHQVGVEMRLCHDAGPHEFGIALRLMRATWADT